jgi:hypothetical protein
LSAARAGACEPRNASKTPAAATRKGFMEINAVSRQAVD